MKKQKLQSKRIMPLLASFALLSGPVLLVTACDHDITRYPAELPSDEQNRILLDFVGVNFSINAKSQFSTTFKQGMTAIKQKVEGVMAEQEFNNFFTTKLNYTKKQADAAFVSIKDNLGLNLLANAYFNDVNTGQNFDATVYQSKLIFETDNWYTSGTTKFNYANVNFYTGDQDPNKLFGGDLYTDLDNANGTFDKIKATAKYADDNYNDIIGDLTKDNTTWDGNSTSPPTPPTLDSSEGANAVANYQKRLERFKWWLRFRYEQYYMSAILPQLNEDLFTMSNLLDSILRFSTDNVSGKPKVQIDNGTYANQLQTWDGKWASKFRYVWDYTTTKSNAATIDSTWGTTPLPDLIKSGKLNSDFFTQLSTSDKSLKNSVDPTFGGDAYISDASSKPYKDPVISNNVASWVTNPADGSHYWGQNQKGSFAYSAPIYWIDDVLNLNFNYYKDKTKTNEIIVNQADDYKGLISQWSTSVDNNTTYSSDFSKYIRGDNIDPSDYDYMQQKKWNTFWQMLYGISSQDPSNPQKDLGATNYGLAGKTLYPKYIKKENVYSEDFWNVINSNYS